MSTPRKALAILVVLLGVPMLAALADEPTDDGPVRIEPVMVRLSQPEMERRETISRAVQEYGIDRALAVEIHDLALEEGILPEIAFALVRVESGFDERAVSAAGARGLTQVMPTTARYLEPGIRNDELFDRQTNLRLGFRYLQMMLDKHDDDLRLALLAYNRGPGTVRRHLERGLDPGNGFATRVLGARFASSAPPSSR